MKKRAAFVLILSSFGILLTGCSVREGASKGKSYLKNIIKKIIGKFDSFFAADKPSKTASGVEYTLSYHK